jgi:pilus assembly protein TadC
MGIPLTLQVNKASGESMTETSFFGLMFESLGKTMVFKRFRPNMRRYFLKAGIPTIPYKIFGLLFILSIFLTLIPYAIFIYPYASMQSQVVLIMGTVITWFIIQIIIVLLLISTIYFYVDLKIFNRTRQMEDVLPDFLQVVSSNLKGGMSFEKALWAGINPRFSVLSEEIAIAAKKVMTGEEMSVALGEFVEKYESANLRRTFDLILSELEGGGKISDVMDKIIENLKEIKALKEEMTAAALTYVIFITSVVIIISPALFALSYQLLIIMGGFAAKIGGTMPSSGIPNMPINFSSFSMDPILFKNFSYASLVVIAVFSSMIVSLIQKGSIKGGVKFIPIFVILSLVCYTLFMSILTSVFSGILLGT